MRKERLIKSTMLWLGVVWAMLINMTNATSSYIHEQYDLENAVNTLTICDPDSDGTKCITMKDRNEWAIEAGTWCSSTDTWACGYNFPWWNNHWFDLFTTPAISRYQVNCSDIGPSTYNGSSFIKWFRDWCSTRNDNLW